MKRSAIRGRAVTRANGGPGLRPSAFIRATGLKKMGFDAVGGTPEQFAAHIKSEVERFTKLVKATGITVD